MKPDEKNKTASSGLSGDGIDLIAPKISETFTEDARREAIAFNRKFSSMASKIAAKRNEAIARGGQTVLTQAMTAVVNAVENADVLSFVKRLGQAMVSSVSRTASALASHRLFKKQMGEDLGGQMAETILDKKNTEDQSGPVPTIDMTSRRPGNGM